MSAFLAVRLPISGRISTVFPTCVASPSSFHPLLTSATQDIDIVVSSFYHDAESIKETIVGADDRYFLESSRQRNATHMILKCRLPGYHAYDRWVKVDILVPPDLNIPEISEWERVMIYDIPVMLLFDLLVIRMQGWWHHRNSSRRDFQEKEAADVTDVVALLNRAMNENVCYQDEEEADRHS